MNIVDVMKIVVEPRIKKNIYVYYVSLVLLTVAISLPHSVLTVLLLSKEVTLPQIMIIQAGYSFAVFISEYPSGLISDIYPKKLVFVYSKFFLLVMFFLVIYMNSFWMLFIAWFMYGISSALDTGTIDAEIINNLRLSEGYIDKFISNANRLNFISLLIGSSIGSFIYYKIGIRFYWVSILLTITSIICVTFFYKGESITNTTISLSEMLKKMIIQTREGIKEIRGKESLKLMITLTFVEQFFFQAHFQLWQALFLSKGINEYNFYIFYIVFQILSIFAYSIPVSKLSHKNLGKHFSILIILLIFSLSLLNTTNKVLFIFVYITYVFIFTVLDFISKYIFAKNVSSERISSLTSLKSSCGRVGALLSMAGCGIILKLTSVSNAIIINFAFAMVMTTLIAIKYLINTKNKAHCIENKASK